MLTLGEDTVSCMFATTGLGGIWLVGPCTVLVTWAGTAVQILGSDTLADMWGCVVRGVYGPPSFHALAYLQRFPLLSTQPTGVKLSTLNI